MSRFSHTRSVLTALVVAFAFGATPRLATAQEHAPGAPDLGTVEAPTKAPPLPKAIPACWVHGRGGDWRLRDLPCSAAAPASKDPVRIYVELWSARPAWRSLSRADRTAFVQEMRNEIRSLHDRGLELLHFAITDQAGPNRTEDRYIVIWQMQDEAAARQIERHVERTGWHRYFNRVSARAKVLPPEQNLNVTMDD